MALSLNADNLTDEKYHNSFFWADIYAWDQAYHGDASRRHTATRPITGAAEASALRYCGTNLWTPRVTSAT